MRQEAVTFQIVFQLFRWHRPNEKQLVVVAMFGGKEIGRRKLHLVADND